MRDECSRALFVSNFESCPIQNLNYLLLLSNFWSMQLSFGIKKTSRISCGTSVLEKERRAYSSIENLALHLICLFLRCESNQNRSSFNMKERRITVCRKVIEYRWFNCILFICSFFNTIIKITVEDENETIFHCCSESFVSLPSHCNCDCCRS